MRCGPRLLFVLLLLCLLALPGLGRLAAWKTGGVSLLYASPGRTEAPSQTAAPLTAEEENSPAAMAAPVVAGYYPWYARLDGYLPADLPAELLTHLHYAFAGIDETGRVRLENPREDLASFAGLRGLREEFPGLMTLLSIGGWDGSQNFSLAARDEEHRRTFARSAAALMEEQGFDGLDLDWEFPVSGGKEGTLHHPEDGENYLRLLQAVREELDARGKAAGRDYLLTAAVSPGSSFLTNVPLAELAEPVDYLFLMGYDQNGPWDALTGRNAPLSAGDGGIKAAVERYLAAGVPREKLVLGTPFYGYLYRLEREIPGQEGLPFASAEPVGYDAIATRWLGEGTRRFDPEGEVPWLSGEGWYLSYDDPSSIAAKGRYARDQGLRGAGAWELSQDREGRLLGALWQSLRQYR